MIRPTVGRVVLFHPTANAPENRPAHYQPFAAFVTYVHSDRLINVGGFDGNGVPFSKCSVTLLQGDEDGPPASSFYAEWMPYQKGQAAKTEALKRAIARFKVGDKVSYHVGPGRYLPATVLDVTTDESKVWYRLETDDAILPRVDSNDVEPA